VATSFEPVSMLTHRDRGQEDNAMETGTRYQFVPYRITGMR
jgi:hypothetical protein